MSNYECPDCAARGELCEFHRKQAQLAAAIPSRKGGRWWSRADDVMAVGGDTVLADLADSLDQFGIAYLWFIRDEQGHTQEACIIPSPWVAEVRMSGATYYDVREPGSKGCLRIQQDSISVLRRHSSIALRPAEIQAASAITVDDDSKKEYASSKREHRYKILRLPLDLLVGLLTRNVRVGDGVARFQDVTGLPDNVEVEAASTHSGFCNNEILLRLYHPSFPVVVEGCSIPEIYLTATERIVRVLPEPTDGSRLQTLLGALVMTLPAEMVEPSVADVERMRRQFEDATGCGKFCVLPSGCEIIADSQAALRQTQDGLDAHGVAYWWRPRPDVLHVLPAEWVLGTTIHDGEQVFRVRPSAEGDRFIHIPAKEVQMIQKADPFNPGSKTTWMQVLQAGAVAMNECRADIKASADARCGHDQAVMSRERVLAALHHLGVVRAGTHSDGLRWSVTDLATDLATALSSDDLSPPPVRKITCSECNLILAVSSPASASGFIPAYPGTMIESGDKGVMATCGRCKTASRLDGVSKAARECSTPFCTEWAARDSDICLDCYRKQIAMGTVDPASHLFHAIRDGAKTVLRNMCEEAKRDIENGAPVMVTNEAALPLHNGFFVRKTDRSPVGSSFHFDICFREAGWFSFETEAEAIQMCSDCQRKHAIRPFNPKWTVAEQVAWFSDSIQRAPAGRWHDDQAAKPMITATDTAVAASPPSTICATCQLHSTIFRSGMCEPCYDEWSKPCEDGSFRVPPHLAKELLATKDRMIVGEAIEIPSLGPAEAEAELPETPQADCPAIVAGTAIALPEGSRLLPNCTLETPNHTMQFDSTRLCFAAVAPSDELKDLPPKVAWIVPSEWLELRPSPAPAEYTARESTAQPSGEDAKTIGSLCGIPVEFVDKLPELGSAPVEYVLAPLLPPDGHAFSRPGDWAHLRFESSETVWESRQLAPDPNAKSPFVVLAASDSPAQPDASETDSWSRPLTFKFDDFSDCSTTTQAGDLIMGAMAAPANPGTISVPTEWTVLTPTAQTSVGRLLLVRCEDPKCKACILPHAHDESGNVVGLCEGPGIMVSLETVEAAVAMGNLAIHAISQSPTVLCKTCGSPARPTQPDGSGWCDDHRPLF